MAVLWRYKLLDEEFGPVPFEILFELAQNGELDRADKVRREVDPNWVAAESVTGLLWPSDDGAEHRGDDIEELRELSELTIVDETKSPIAAVPDELRDLSELDFQFANEDRAAPTPTIATTPESTAAGRTRPETGDHRWYCRILGQELGPFLWDDLSRLVHDDELSADDQVKQGDDGSWAPAASVEGLFSAKPQSSAVDATATPAVDAAPVFPISPSRAAGHATSNMTAEIAQNFPANVSRTIERTSPARIVDPSQASPIRPTPRTASSSSKRSSTGGPKLNPQVIFGIVGFSTLVLLNVFLWPFGSDSAENATYATCTRIWGELKQHRTNPSTPDRAAFVARSKEQLEPIVKVLKVEAGAKYPIRQHLLWASQDLLKALEQTGTANKTKDAELDKHLDEAQRLLHGGDSPAQRTRPQRSKKPSKAPR